LSPTPRFEDDSPLDGIVLAFAILSATCLLAGVALRWLLSQVLAHALKRKFTVGDFEARALRVFDGLLAVAAGVCGGLVLTLALALLLRGAPGGLGLHLMVFALALWMAGGVLIYVRGVARLTVVSALLVLAGATLLGGLIGRG
jgi:hypothetical protein